MGAAALPIIAILGLAMFAGSGKKKKGSAAAPQKRWLEEGDPCDPLDKSRVPPGYGCYVHDNGQYYVSSMHDPAAPVPVDYGEFGDEQGMGEALELLGFAQMPVQARVAAFQSYAVNYFGLDPGELRQDGRPDQLMIELLHEALVDYGLNQWESVDDVIEEEMILQFEEDNARTVVQAWLEEPMWSFMHDKGLDRLVEPGPDYLLSRWLTDLIYWQMYHEGDGEAPRNPFASIPPDPEWIPVWQRIHGHVADAMDDSGLNDGPLF